MHITIIPRCNPTHGHPSPWNGDTAGRRTFTQTHIVVPVAERVFSFAFVHHARAATPHLHVSCAAYDARWWRASEDALLCVRLWPRGAGARKRVPPVSVLTEERSILLLLLLLRG